MKVLPERAFRRLLRLLHSGCHTLPVDQEKQKGRCGRPFYLLNKQC